MKKIKSLILSFLFLLTFTFGFCSVSAISYTEYKSGDEIIVNVSDIEKVDFYVVKDSDSESETVTAITSGFVSENMDYESALSVVSETLKVWKNVNNISLPSAKELLNVDVNLENEYSSETFTEPTWVSPKTSEFTEYWLSEEAYDGAHAVIWGMDTYHNSQFHLSSKADTEKIYVKLLVEVDKKYIEGGVVMTPWESFVDYFINTDFYYGDDISEENVSITHDDKSLTINVVENDKTYVTKYLYENGILTYSQKGNLLYDDNYFNSKVLSYFIDEYNYNFSKFYNYIYSAYPSNNWSIDKDGIECTLEELYTEEEVIQLQKELDEYLATLDEETRKDYEADGLDEVFNPLIFSKFKIDLDNGLKTYDETKVPFYNMEIEGRNYEVGKSESIIVRIYEDFEQFDSVYVDGKLVDKANYEAKSGSTIVTLKKVYLDKLSSGEHTLKITFKNGEFAETKFTVEVKNVSTGVKLGYEILVLIVLISVIGYFFIRKQSKFPKHN